MKVLILNCNVLNEQITLKLHNYLPQQFHQQALECFKDVLVGFQINVNQVLNDFLAQVYLLIYLLIRTAFANISKTKQTSNNSNNSLVLRHHIFDP